MVVLAEEATVEGEAAVEMEAVWAAAKVVVARVAVEAVESTVEATAAALAVVETPAVE